MNNFKKIIFVSLITIWYSCEEALIPPLVNISTEFTGSVSGTVSIAVEAVSPIGIEKVELWVDGEYADVFDETDPYELVWNTTIYENNSIHFISVRVYDTDGKHVDTDPIEIVVDNSISNAVLTLPYSGSLSDTVSITVLASSPIGINNVELWVDGEYSNVSDNTEPYELIWNTAIYENNSNHIIFARIYDIADNYVDSDSIEVIIDNSMDSVSISLSDSLGYVYEDVNISVSALSPIGISNVELWVDGEYSDISDNTEPYDLTWNTAIYEDYSSHILFARVYDNADRYIDSDSIEVIVNNSSYIPNPVELYPIIFSDNIFSITWSVNNDDDFQSYTLIELDIADSTDLSIVYTTDINSDTSFVIDGLTIGEKRLYQVIVEDTFGLISKSNIELGQTTNIWSGYYDYMNLSDWGNSIIEVEDGYWATGVADQNIRIIKTDFDGQLVADITFASGYGNQIIESEDGSLFIIGGNLIENSMMVIKTDNFGNEIWRRSFGTDAWAYGGMIRENGELIIFGEEYAGFGGVARVYTIDQDGQNINYLLWDNEMDRYIGIIRGSSDLLGYESYYIASVKDYYTKISKIDIDDNIDTVYTETIAELPGYNRSLTLDDTGELLVTLQTNDNEHSFLKIDPTNGSDIIWEYSASGLYNGFRFNDDYYTIGVNDNGMSLIAKINSDGSVESETVFNGGILTDFSFTSDGGLIFTGTTSFWGDYSSDTPFYKTDTNLELDILSNFNREPGINFINTGINNFNINPLIKNKN